MNPDPTDPMPAAAPRPALWFVHVASWVLAAMAVVAFCDVALRVAGRPITGAYELTALLMGLLVYATLPLVTAQDEHVRAGILQMWRTAPNGLVRTLREIRKILSCVALAYLAWALFQYMLRVGAAGDRAPYIDIPLSWVAGFGALSMALSAVMALWSQRRIGGGCMTATLIAMAVMLALIALEVPIAVAMLVTGVVGCLSVLGWSPTLFMVGETAFSTVNNYSLTVVPLFILMGNLINEADISRELYRTTYRFVGHLRGGLAIATVLACAAFAAICGSSLATSAAMTRVAYPEMKRYGYSDALSTGCIASAGTLGIMIPPSVALMVYGIMTQTDIGKLFIAGVLPGLLGALLYVGAVMVYTWRHPESGPAGERSTWTERLHSLRGIGSVVLLFGLVIGGLYGGWFTPTEAAGIGAAGAFAIVVARGRLTRKMLAQVLRETAVTTTSLFFILIGALVLSKYITISGFTPWLGGVLQGMDLSAMQFLLIICAMYLVLGCFLESMSMLLLTLPIVFPLVVSYGIDPIWFGVLIVTLIEVALITPPVGMNVYMLASQIPSVPLNVVFRGASAFVAADVIRLGILLAVPAIALWLPSIT